MIKNFMRKRFERRENAFDGLIVAIALILISLIGIFVIYKTVVPKTNSSMTNVGKEIDSISDWNIESGGE